MLEKLLVLLEMLIGIPQISNTARESVMEQKRRGGVSEMLSIVGS